MTTTTQSVADVMTPDVVSVPPTAPVSVVAQRMRDQDIGDVLLVENDQLVGIVTDRDLAVRVVAEQLDPALTRALDVCSSAVVSVDRDAPVEEAVKLMRDAAVRRLPVVEEGRPVGVVAIGDLAVERDPKSALADISAAPPNQ